MCKQPLSMAPTAIAALLLQQQGDAYKTCCITCCTCCFTPPKESQQGLHNRIGIGASVGVAGAGEQYVQAVIVPMISSTPFFFSDTFLYHYSVMHQLRKSLRSEQTPSDPCGSNLSTVYYSHGLQMPRGCSRACASYRAPCRRFLVRIEPSGSQKRWKGSPVVDQIPNNMVVALLCPFFHIIPIQILPAAS